MKMLLTKINLAIKDYYWFFFKLPFIIHDLKKEEERFDRMRKFWTDEESNLPILPNSQVFKSGRYFAGDKAVQAVEQRLGTALPDRYKDVIREEGFVVGKYLDDKGILTSGMGQTQEYLNTSPLQALQEKEGIASLIIDDYDSYSEDVKGALLSAVYRGDMKASNKWVQYFNKGQFDKASKEFLDHREYKERKKRNPNDGVVKRLEHISKTIKKAGKSKPTTSPIGMKTKK